MWEWSRRLLWACLVGGCFLRACTPDTFQLLTLMWVLLVIFTVCHSLPPSGQHAVCCFLFTCVEEGYESNQYKVSEACSNLVIQAKSKCNIPSVTSPPWNRSLCGRWSKGCDGEGAREETGSGNVHFKNAVLLCLRSSSAWLKTVSYRVRSMWSSH